MSIWKYDDNMNVIIMSNMCMIGVMECYNSWKIAVYMLSCFTVTNVYEDAMRFVT